MTTAVAPTGTADLRAQRRLVELEGVIQGGLQTFTEVGQALLEIRDSRLYRFGGFATIDDYLRERWHMSRSYAHRIMEATEVQAALPMGNGLTTERQARELAPVLREHGPEAVREVWTETVERTNGHPTAAVVREVVRERVRGLAAESEAELQAATAGWTPEQRAAVAPDVMRQRGELIRLIRDLGALPDALSLAHEHRAFMPRDFVAEAAFACGWLEEFCDGLEGKR